jgi:E3 ubiquitin-protein ligase HUWE1
MNMLMVLALLFAIFQVPLEGFSALQGISGSQKFQIHKAYGSPEHLPSAHTWYFIIINFFLYSIVYEMLMLTIYDLCSYFGANNIV